MEKTVSIEILPVSGQPSSYSDAEGLNSQDVIAAYEGENQITSDAGEGVISKISRRTNGKAVTSQISTDSDNVEGVISSDHGKFEGEISHISTANNNGVRAISQDSTANNNCVGVISQDSTASFNGVGATSQISMSSINGEGGITQNSTANMKGVGVTSRISTTINNEEGGITQDSIYCAAEEGEVPHIQRSGSVEALSPQTTNMDGEGDNPRPSTPKSHAEGVKPHPTTSDEHREGVSMPDVSPDVVAPDDDEADLDSQMSQQDRKLLQGIVDGLREASDSEASQDLPTVLTQYTTAIEAAIYTLKHSGMRWPDQVRSTLRGRISICLDRAHPIKQLLPREEKTTTYADIVDSLVVHSDVKWTDIVGLQHARDKLMEWILLPLKFPRLFTGVRRPYRRNQVLLYGLPGCGKTMLITALANEIEDCTLFLVSAHQLLPTALCPEPEKMIRALFDAAERCTTSIIAIDNVEDIFDHDNGPGNHVCTELLVALNRYENYAAGEHIVIYCCTRPHRLWSHLRRRFPWRIFVNLPDVGARNDLLHQNLHAMTAMSKDLSSDDITEIAIRTHGWTCSDVVILVRGASMSPIRELLHCNYRQVCREDVPAAGMVSGPASDVVYVPCEADTPGAQNLSLTDLSDKAIYTRPITLADLRTELNKIHSSVDSEMNNHILKFHEDYGPEYVCDRIAIKTLRDLARHSILHTLSPTLTCDESSFIQQLFDVVDPLPIPRSLKLYLMLGSSQLSVTRAV